MKRYKSGQLFDYLRYKTNFGSTRGKDKDLFWHFVIGLQFYKWLQFIWQRCDLFNVPWPLGRKPSITRIEVFNTSSSPTVRLMSWNQGPVCQASHKFFRDFFFFGKTLFEKYLIWLKPSADYDFTGWFSFWVDIK